MQFLEESKPLENFTYNLHRTPCANVINNGICSYPKNITKLFPNDLLLKKMSVEGYVGVPLFDSKQKPNGILVSLFRREFSDTDLVESILLLFASRIGAELEHQKTYTRHEALRKETEKTKEQYRLLVENQTDLIVKVDKKNRFMFVSPSYCKMFGKSEKELIGKTFVPLIHEDDQEHTLEEMKKLTHPPYTCYIEQRVMTTEGWRWLAWTDTAILNKEGTIDSVIGSGKDITERKLIENKIIENEKLLKQIQRITKMGSFRHSFNENISYWSENTARIFGLGNKALKVNPDEIANKYILKEDLKHFYENLNKVINDNIKAHSNYRIKTPDGKIKYISSHVQVLKNKNGVPYEMIGSVQDITELKTIEEELKKAKLKAEESDRLKSAFLANMSHEIRTPMNAILGFSNLIAHKTQNKEKAVNYFNIIKSSSNQLARIISDIIDISKIEAGEIELSYTTFNLHEFINEKFEQINLYCREKNKTTIEVKYVIANELTEITTDKERFSQIIMNLLTNAVKFTESGTIILSIDKTNNKNIELNVSDTGIGIEKSKQKIIFKRFRQADESDSFKGGTGLGLAITKALVEKMGGAISVESMPNKGTTFRVNLPLQQNSTKHKLIKKNIITKGIKKMKTKVLVAEDEEVNFLYINEVLGSPDFDVVHAWDGKQAIELFTKEQPDLIIMDIKMPIMNGYEALKVIKEMDNTIPIIALTAHALSGDREKALNAGFDAYLSKPVSEEIILETVKELIRSN